MLTADERGNVEIVAVKNTYDAKRDARPLVTAIDDATIRIEREAKNA